MSEAHASEAARGGPELRPRPCQNLVATYQEAECLWVFAKLNGRRARQGCPGKPPQRDDRAVGTVITIMDGGGWEGGTPCTNFLQSEDATQAGFELGIAAALVRGRDTINW